MNGVIGCSPRQVLNKCQRCWFSPTGVFEVIIGGVVAPCNFLRCSCYCVHPAVLIFCLRASRGAPFVCLDKEGGESRGTVRVLTSWLWAPPSGCDWQIASVRLLIRSLPSDLRSASQHCNGGGRRRVMRWGGGGPAKARGDANTQSYAHIWTGRVMLRKTYKEIHELINTEK